MEISSLKIFCIIWIPSFIAIFSIYHRFLRNVFALSIQITVIYIVIVCQWCSEENEHNVTINCLLYLRESKIKTVQNQWLDIRVQPYFRIPRIMSMQKHSERVAWLLTSRSRSVITRYICIIDCCWFGALCHIEHEKISQIPVFVLFLCVCLCQTCGQKMIWVPKGAPLTFDLLKNQ